MARRYLCLLLAVLLPFATLYPKPASAQATGPSALPKPSDQLILPEPAISSETGWSSYITTERMVQGAGALLGIVAFNFYVAPLSVASGVGAGASIRSLLGTRVTASMLAAAGAVMTTYIYDRWTDQPINYDYFWSRGGAVVGVGAGSALLTIFGFPSATALPRFSPAWVANRGFLVGTALLGAWMTDLYLDSKKPVAAPAAPIAAAK